MENTVKKNNTTLYSYFPAPLSVEGYFAILDQDPPVLSVLQAPGRAGLGPPGPGLPPPALPQ